jgi:F-type H+-transporting ATPase subunit a
MLGEVLEPQSVVVLVNAGLVAAFVVAVCVWLTRGGLSVDDPKPRQVVGEAILSFFANKARDMAPGPQRTRLRHTVAATLATFFLYIICCNLVGAVPLPFLNRPPTSSFGVTLGLALASVVGTLVISSTVKGIGGTFKHLFWPNPLQWVSEVTDVMSLSLRLFGNIAGEYMTVTLVLAVVPWGIPLVLHALGLIPAFIQALVFTLLTASFIAGSIGEEEQHDTRGPQESALPASGGSATS